MIYENAAISLEMCRSVLEREGQDAEARALHGLEVTCPASAEGALEALRSICARTRGARRAKDFALLAVYCASKAQPTVVYA